MLIVLKILTSAIIIALLSELAKRNTGLAGFLAAMPITTLLVMIWLYVEKRDLVQLGELSQSIFWAIIPSMLFFIPPMIFFKRGVNFYFVLLLSFCLLYIGYLIHKKFLA